MSTLKTDVLKDVAETVSVNTVDLPGAINLRADLANATDPAKGAALVGYSGSTVAAELDAINAIKTANIVTFGADPTGVNFSTTAILDAIASVRDNPVSILDTIGGSTITAYSSGVVEFPRGVFKVAPDTLKVWQDLGLTLRGQGSRRTNNAVRAATTILISGTSAGFGIQQYRSGGRGLTIEDMDICYESAAFTGDVFDTFDSPGPTLNRVFLGTYGLTGATRLQTARSLIRSTYDEFLTCNNCVFDGAVDGWWSDDIREEFGNPFGGSVTSFNECVWYDFTNTHVRADGNRGRSVVTFKSCGFNPISVDCVRVIDLNNVEGLNILGGISVGSIANKATTEWMRLVNCTGNVQGFLFDDLSKAGSLDGMLSITGCRIYSTDGLTLRGGVISAKSNEFSKCTNGYTLSPNYQLTVDLGPDNFKNLVTTSYYVPAEGLSLEGRINYDYMQDASTNLFSNASSGIEITNISSRLGGVTAELYNIGDILTGKRIIATGGSAQTFTLPDATPGLSYLITKISGATLTVNCAAANNFYRGDVATPTSASITTAAELGSTLELKSIAGTGWLVVGQTGGWTFS